MSKNDIDNFIIMIEPRIKKLVTHLRKAKPVNIISNVKFFSYKGLCKQKCF